MTARVGDLSQYMGLEAVKGKRVLSYHFYVEVTVYPQKDLIDIIKQRTRPKIRLNLDPSETSSTGGSLFQFSWNKNVGKAAGNWSCGFKVKSSSTLNPRNMDILDGDWVDIWIVRNGVRIPLCRGVIDVAREQTVSMQGATVRTWMLTGRDHGALAEYPITYHNPWLQSLTQQVQGKFTEAAGGRVGGSPEVIFRTLLEAVFSKAEGTTVWTLPETLAQTLGVNRFLDALWIDDNKPLRGAYYNQVQFWTMEGQNLDQTMNQWLNPLLNYWVFDVDPHGRQVIIGAQEGSDKSGLSKGQLGQAKTAELVMMAKIRERPFPATLPAGEGLQGPWFNKNEYPVWRIPDWLCNTTNLGRDGHERYNLFQLTSDASFMGTQPEQYGIAPPRWYPQGIDRRGIRAWIKSTKYLAQFNKGDGAIQEERVEWQQLLQDWHAINPYLRHGTLGVKALFPEIRITNKAMRDTGKRETSETFWVEGVDLRYNAPTSATSGPMGETTFAVTRGFTGTDQELMDLVTKLDFMFEDKF